MMTVINDKPKLREMSAAHRGDGSERTPLIQRVPVEERRVVYPHQTVGALRQHLWQLRHQADGLQVRRFCTILLITVPILTLAIIFFCVAIAGQSDLFGDHQTEQHTFSALEAGVPHTSWPASEGLSFDNLKKILRDTPSPEKARQWSKYYTAGPHLTGKNRTQAEWTRDRWESWGVKSALASYDVYINYPVSNHLAMLEDGKVKFTASLEEDVLEEDPTSGLKDRIPVFHGYSASGNVTAPYVYCNYGTYADFEELQKAGVELEGKIALIKYGGIFRGLKLKRASELGMIGGIIYTDPGDDGDITEENGYKQYPEGPARQESSVQRGSVEYLSKPSSMTHLQYHTNIGILRRRTRRPNNNRLSFSSRCPTPVHRG